LAGHPSRAPEEVHGLGFVHGDLRVPNILVKDDGVFFICFYWAWQQGAAKYPLHLNQDVEWHPEAGVGVNIEYAHVNTW
jgi:hypothetical protein